MLHAWRSPVKQTVNFLFFGKILVGPIKESIQ